LLPVETTRNETSVNPYVKARQQGQWPRKPKQSSAPSLVQASAFANRTSDWMKLSQMAAGALVSTRSQRADPEPKATPTVPPERFKTRPKGWGDRAWDEYEKAAKAMAPFRGARGNQMATFASLFLGADNCILKLMYVFYHEDGEDDYPYVPRGCGDMFDFAILGANGMHVPWMLIVGALFIVTGTHSSPNFPS
jgi:hypothetical protein